MHGVGPELGPDGALLLHVQLGRQGAGAEQQRQVGGAVLGEIAGDLARTAQDHALDGRVGDDFAVQHDGEAMADVARRHLAELLAAGAVEADIDVGLAALAVEAGLGVGEAGAGDDDPPAHQHALGLGRIAAGQQLVLRRDMAGDLGDIGRVVQHLEGQLGGLADHALQPLRVALARRLDHDAVGALADDGRLAGAQRIDAPAQDLDRLVHRLGRARPLELRRVGQDQGLVGAVANREIATAAAGDLTQLAQGGSRRADLGGGVDPHLDGRARPLDLAKAGETDACGLQRAPHVLHQIGQLLGAQGGGVDFQQ